MEFIPYLIFRLHHSLYGLSSFSVQEIFFLPELTPIAETRIDIVGVMNLRGEILPIIDLNLRLGYQSSEYSLSDTIIVLQTPAHQYGLIVNEVYEIKNFTPAEIKTNLASSRTKKNGTALAHANFIAGIANLGNDVVMLLNHENLLTTGNHTSNAALARLSQNPLTTDLDSVELLDHNSLREPPLFCPNATPEVRKIFRDRAENLMLSTEIEASTGLIPLAVIGLNGEYFGLNLPIVREFTEIGQVTPVPCCPSHIVGSMNLRGEIVTLVDIRGVLNLPLSEISDRSKTMVVHVDHVVAGITVDEVFDVMYLHPSAIQPVPVAVHSGREDYLRGTAHYREKMMSILDLEKILLDGSLIVNEEV